MDPEFVMFVVLRANQLLSTRNYFDVDVHLEDSSLILTSENRFYLLFHVCVRAYMHMFLSVCVCFPCVQLPLAARRGCWNPGN